LTFFKSGPAASFADLVLRQERRTHRPYFANWAAFEKEFAERYLPRNRKKVATLQLEGVSWHQGSDSVDTYIDRFQELIDYAEVVVDGTTVAKFRRGLNKSIRSQIATSDNPPTFEDLKGWMTAARAIAENREESRTFEENVRAVERLPPAPRTFPAAPKAVITAPTFPMRTFSRPAPPIPHKPATPVAPGPTMAPAKPTEGPTPMEVDRAHSFDMSTIICRRCGQPGHFARSCTRPLDVRALEMSLEEKRDLFMQLAAELDTSGVPAEEPLDIEEADTEDFRNCSE
jgi:hypothetical protein